MISVGLFEVIVENMCMLLNCVNKNHLISTLIIYAFEEVLFVFSFFLF